MVLAISRTVSAISVFSQVCGCIPRMMMFFIPIFSTPWVIGIMYYDYATILGYIES